MKYKVNEIFYSLQGEGAKVGMAATFIRMAGCNLSCPWCDTDFSHKLTLDEAELVEECHKNPAKSVIITGGEPSLQDLRPLLRALKKGRYYTSIETNGTNNLLAYKGAGLLNWITVSPKSQEIAAVDAMIDEIKVIWPTSLSLSRVASVRARYHYLQPCDGPDKQKNTEEAIEYVRRHPKWRLSLQTQKILGLK